MKKRMMHRLLALLCVLALTAGMLPIGALAAVNGPNLLKDGVFDTGLGWSFTGGGSRGGVSGGHFWLDNYTPTCRMSQQVTIPADGTYHIEGSIKTGSDEGEVNAKFGVRYVDGTIIQEQALTTGMTATIDLGNHSLQKDDQIEIYVEQLAAGSWINGDDFLIYDTDYLPPPEPPADYSGNLLDNPGFEDGLTGWRIKNGQWQGNNPHGGSGHFGLNWTDGLLSQSVTVPYTGLYQNYGYFVAGAGGGSYGMRMQGATEALEEVPLPGRTIYGDPDVLPGIELKQGDIIEVYCKGGNGWVNGDDFFLGYDFANITYNLLTGVDLTEGRIIRLPWAGDYKFSADIAAAEETTLTVGEECVIVPADATRAVTLAVTGQELDTMLELTANGDCAVSNASLTLDISNVENAAPTADNVVVTGEIMTGLRLAGSYTFDDEDEGLGGEEGLTAFRWLAADAADGDYAPIGGAVGKTLLLTEGQADKYIKLEVTPVDLFGEAGSSVCSTAAGPVILNYVANASLDIQIDNNPVGWAVRNGGVLANNKARARTDLRYVSLPAADADAEAYYTLAVPKTAHYSVGAWVNTGAEAGTFGVRTKSGIMLGTVALQDTEKKYAFLELRGVALEKGAEVEVFIQSGSGNDRIWADDFQLLYQDEEDVPPFTTLHSFEIRGQVERTIDSEHRTISVFVPYGTNVTALEITAAVSEGAVLTPASGSRVDFTSPVTFTITNGAAATGWTVTCTVDEQRIALKSDNETLQSGFNWAARKLNQFVMTGKRGLINKDERRPNGTGEADYEPSYWAGYYDRTAYYSRDFVHQAVGGQIAGLWNENYNMFQTFARNATEARKWYTLWAFNFNGEPHIIDYNNDESFVREVPAQFELVEKLYKQFLWSGDRRYIEDPVLAAFCDRVMSDFITLHDSNGNGIAEGTGGGIFEGTCTYNELPGERAIESGDAIGAQYQATLAYAAILKERGEDTTSGEWYAKAAALKRYFDEEWSVKDPENPEGQYVRTLGIDGAKYDGFGHENSWFIPMKLLTEPGARNDAYLDYIETQMGDYIGQHPGIHTNVEAWSYLPDTYFPYNRNDTAWKYMKYILSIKDLPHQRPSQGTNGDYPEVSYTFLSHTIEGMMGIEPDAYNHKLATAPRLPTEVGYIDATYVRIGDHVLDVRHDGLTKTTLTNHSEHGLQWEARFYGNYPVILVDGKAVNAGHKNMNGVQVSYTVVDVSANGAAAAEAYQPPTYGGSSDTTTKAEGNPDGSTTTTVTYKKIGTVVVTTVWPDGTEIVTTTTKDGASISEVTVPEDKDNVTVTIPMNRAPTPGEVAVIVRPDGTRETVKTSVTTEKGIRVTLTEGGKLEIADNSKQFVDVAARDWFDGAVQFVASREILNGTGAKAFSPAAPMSRAMLMTALARLDGQDTTLGEHWHSVGMEWAKENGISDGANPEASVTREQLVIMLYRYAGANKAVNSLSAFPDADRVSDWAFEGMAWAVESGIITGIDNSRLDPGGGATRAEVAAMLERFIKRS